MRFKERWREREREREEEEEEIPMHSINDLDNVIAA